MAVLLQDMRGPLGPGIEPVSPELAGRLQSSTAPPGKSLACRFLVWLSLHLVQEGNVSRGRERRRDWASSALLPRHQQPELPAPLEEVVRERTAGEYCRVLAGDRSQKEDRRQKG